MHFIGVLKFWAISEWRTYIIGKLEAEPRGDHVCPCGRSLPPVRRPQYTQDECNMDSETVMGRCASILKDHWKDCGGRKLMISHNIARVLRITQLQVKSARCRQGARLQILVRKTLVSKVQHYLVRGFVYEIIYFLIGISRSVQITKQVKQAWPPFFWDWLCEVKHPSVMLIPILKVRCSTTKFSCTCRSIEYCRKWGCL